MNFMAEFRMSMEDNIQKANLKLDTKLQEINVEIKDIKEIIDKNEDQSNNVINRMDARLKKLELEMKKIGNS